jgi:hypothetical protein
MTTTLSLIPQTETTKRRSGCPAVILDGKVIEWFALPSFRDGTTDYTAEVVEPVTWEEGPEGCGSGPVTITGGRLRVTRSYYVEYYDAVDAGGRWWNYGAPSGTHVEARVKWVRDTRVAAGCAGHTIDGRFPHQGERVTHAGRVETAAV